ncbi:hypothetical protein [Bartonella sp. MR63HLJHH]|uniref:hypothetical protein n=1 Tax=Bartonella sp. MR63HLJHH TaxID=3243558 RepID=UPI0035D0A8EC
MASSGSSHDPVSGSHLSSLFVSGDYLSKGDNIQIFSSNNFQSWITDANASIPNFSKGTNFHLGGIIPVVTGGGAGAVGGSIARLEGVQVRAFSVE